MRQTTWAAIAPMVLLLLNGTPATAAGWEALAGHTYRVEYRLTSTERHRLGKRQPWYVQTCDDLFNYYVSDQGRLFLSLLQQKCDGTVENINDLTNGSVIDLKVPSGAISNGDNYQVRSKPGGVEVKIIRKMIEDGDDSKWSSIYLWTFLLREGCQIRLSGTGTSVLIGQQGEHSKDHRIETTMGYVMTSCKVFEGHVE